MKKFLSILLVVMLVLSMIPATVSAADTELAATFNLGANGSASHNDGSEKTSHSESNNGYTLSITGGTKMYTGARDQKGNGCIKLGTSKAAGSFSLKAPDGVVEVKIYVAKYKTNNATVTVNGTATTLTKNSNNGEYDVITVDTSTQKTVNLKVSSGNRAMVNTIEFYTAIAGGACRHENKATNIVPATCTVDGSENVVCKDCGETISSTPIPAGHKWNEGEETTPATCTSAGVKTFTCSECSETKTEAIAQLSHTYVDGICTECGAEEPNEVVFELGADGAAEHKETTGSVVTYSETVNEYTLNITGGTKMYLDCTDSTGNGCIKLGTGSAAGSFSFVVPENVYEVKIYIAGYKSNDAKININGTNTTIKNHSDNGEYTEIVVDTSEDKTVTVTTVSGGYRAMVNTIVFCYEPINFVTPEDGKTFATLGDAIAASYPVKAVSGEELPEEFVLNPEGETPQRFVTLGADNEGFYTYYELSLELTNVSLRSSEAGIYYTAKINAKDFLEAIAEKEDVSYGIMLSLEGTPTNLVAGQYTSVAGVPANGTAFLSGSVFGIFDEELDGEENQARAGFPIYAVAYIKVGGQMFTSTRNVACSFETVLKAVDKKVTSLEGPQLEALEDFYTMWNGKGAIKSSWNLENMAAQFGA